MWQFVVGNCYLGSPGISLFWLSLYLLAYFFWSSFMGFSAIKSFIFTWFHLISLHLISLFHILKSIYTLTSLLVLKLLVLTAFSVDFTAECLTGISSSSFVEVNSLSYHFSFLFLSTVHFSECTTIHVVLQTGNIGVILSSSLLINI